MTLFKGDRTKHWIFYLITGGAIVLFFWYFVENAGKYEGLAQLSPTPVLLLAGLGIATGVANGLINYFLFRSLKVQLGIGEAVALAMVNTLANQLPFAGGLAAKGMYLKQRHHLSYTGYLSATLALYVFSMVVSGIAGLAIILYWGLRGASVPVILSGGFLIMSASGLIFLIPARTELLPQRWRPYVATLLEGWQLLQHRRMIVLQILGTQFLAIIIFAGRLWIAFHALSQEVTLAQCVLLSAGTVLTQLVNITPGGLGVREGIVTAIAHLMGMEFGVALIAVGLDRLVATSAIIVAGLLSSTWLGRNMFFSTASGQLTITERACLDESPEPAQER